jgi:hypothetical protein
LWLRPLQQAVARGEETEHARSNNEGHVTHGH